MFLTDQKSFAESMREAASNKAAIIEVAKEYAVAFKDDFEFVNLCNRFKAAPDAFAVIKLADEIKNKQV